MPTANGLMCGASVNEIFYLMEKAMESVQLNDENAAVERPLSQSNINIPVPGEPADFTAINVEGCLSSSNVIS
ncbi:hypothetical protein MK974_15510 [Burkholderia ambifaria]|uniref:hypothetical protein n=1 Tax=Burkholderia ambifaria TaxID=152480 RepID=UPI0022A99440|nr:hypothetical protein [Burkholderia ambifaria]WAS54115.1 hypothetical protein MK974_15510 [Burkholderia ambifaria]